MRTKVLYKACKVAAFIVLFAFGYMLGELAISRNTIDCNQGCQCKEGGECRCFVVATDKCRCSECNCVCAPLCGCQTDLGCTCKDKAECECCACKCGNK